VQIEPLSVAVHAVANLANFRATQTIAVWGAGPVGLLCMAVAKALGAARVIAIDIVPSRLGFAKGYVATDVFLPPALNPDENTMEYSKRCADAMIKEFGLQERGGVNTVDVAVDASGAEPSIQTALHVVKAGGTFVQVRFTDCAPARNADSALAWYGDSRCADTYDLDPDQGGYHQGLLQIRS